jgi:endonuclease YncB( thermonuclease family)
MTRSRAAVGAALLFLGALAHAGSWTVEGRVAGVSDGDTLTLLDRASYAAAEDDARARRVGLWKDAEPVAPWEFRKGPR